MMEKKNRKDAKRENRKTANGDRGETVEMEHSEPHSDRGVTKKRRVCTTRRLCAPAAGVAPLKARSLKKRMSGLAFTFILIKAITSAYLIILR